MKKILHFILFTLIIYLIIKSSSHIIENIKFSFSICVNNVFPSLIPFLLISNIIIKYNFIDELSDIFNNLMTKVFKVSKYCSFALVMSMISGTPSNSKYLKDLLENKFINLSDVKKCLNFIHFNNPIFILGTVGYSFLNSKKMGLIILISHYLSAATLGLFNKKSEIININYKVNKNNNFFVVLKNAINNTIDTLLLILGIITTCLIVTALFDYILHINNNYKFIYGILEITQGLKYLSSSNLSLEFKTILSVFFVSFGGLCIHAQVFLIIENKKIKYLPYLFSRISHALLSSLISYILINMFP